MTVAETLRTKKSHRRRKNEKSRRQKKKDKEYQNVFSEKVKKDSSTESLSSTSKDIKTNTSDKDKTSHAPLNIQANHPCVKKNSQGYGQVKGQYKPIAKLSKTIF